MKSSVINLKQYYNYNGNLDKDESRYGSNSNGNYNAVNVNSDGNVNNNNVNNTNSVRPAFCNLNDGMTKVILLGRQKTKIITDILSKRKAEM